MTTITECEKVALEEIFIALNSKRRKTNKIKKAKILFLKISSGVKKTIFYRPQIKIMKK